MCVSKEFNIVLGISFSRRTLCRPLSPVRSTFYAYAECTRSRSSQTALADIETVSLPMTRFFSVGGKSRRDINHNLLHCNASERTIEESVARKREEEITEFDRRRKCHSTSRERDTTKCQKALWKLLHSCLIRKIGISDERKCGLALSSLQGKVKSSFFSVLEDCLPSACMENHTHDNAEKMSLMLVFVCFVASN